MLNIKYITIFSLTVFIGKSFAQVSDNLINEWCKKIEPKVISWRRDFHQNPELSNREFITAKKIEIHLKSLGLEIKSNVAHTGVVAILKGEKLGKCIALRADMDALPIEEKNTLPFASKVKSEYNNEEVSVMHACGHDTHIAILVGVAEILAQNKKYVYGTIKFIFQPAEEGAPDGEEGGAELMVKEGVMENPHVDYVFGLHIASDLEVGKIGYRNGSMAANVDNFVVNVRGKQTHGAYPWYGIDPIVVTSHIITQLQTIVSRNIDLINNPAVVTIGAIKGGVRENIIPYKVNFYGTIRTLDSLAQKTAHKNFIDICTGTGRAMGAEVDVKINNIYPSLINHYETTKKILPLLEKASNNNIEFVNQATGGEDFPFFLKKAKGTFFLLGGKPKNISKESATSHHSPEFFIDESGFIVGLKSFCQIVLNGDFATK
jgi:amidohydrolase